jgi:bifunctional UDP-N-acetylglucosamine pyrophosphorylase/glucosamine-1-phosphate N-acetyltransferase
LRAEQAVTGAAATLLTAELDDPGRYGRIVRTAGGDVAAIVEYKAATAEQRAIHEINSGIYCFQAELLWRHLGEIEPNPVTGELYLTDIVEIFNRHGYRVTALHPETPQEILGVNTRIELAEADRILRDRKRRDLMLAGVTIEQPETVAIDADVQIGADSVIEPFVRLLGATRIGEECRIGAGSILEGATIAAGVRVKPYTLIADSRVAEGAEIGPFARLRSNVRVGAGAHIGNFAEMKNTSFGAGSKSNHVSYLGDATVGENTNIGAGTIICNYDGEKKHPSRIGDRAFVGSNSTLVAPIEIGDDSYIGAGSVITEDVPSETLALGRARQVNNAAWVKRRRERKGAE